jgi:hypothetical protein
MGSRRQPIANQLAQADGDRRGDELLLCKDAVEMLTGDIGPTRDFSRR